MNVKERTAQPSEVMNAGVLPRPLRPSEAAWSCLTRRQEKRKQTWEKRVRDALKRAGLTLKHFNADSKGYAAHLNLQNCSCNAVGGREDGWGIR